MSKRIALIGSKTVEYLEKLLEIWHECNCACLFDNTIPPETLKDMLKEAKVERCYIEEGMYAGFAEFKDIELIFYSSNKKSIQKVPRELIESFSPSYSKEDAVVIYSSGTTGKSKGIVLSFWGINTNADYISAQYAPDEIHTILVARNLFHSSTLVCDLLVALKRKWEIVLSNFVSPKELFSAIYNYNISVLCLNPSILRIYNRYLIGNSLKDDFVSRIYSSGDGMDVETYNQTRECFLKARIFNCYGLSECGPRVTSSFREIRHNGYLSVGKPLGDADIVIVGESNEKLDAYEIGEILVKTPCIFSYYISSAVQVVGDENTWFHTKDLGFLDNEENLYIVGRKDDMIIIDAHKIYPKSVEDVIRKLEGILDCFVFAVSLDSRKELVCVYEAEANILKQDLLSHCRSKLLHYEVPQRFIKHKVIRNSNGKIDRKGNLDLYHSIIRGKNDG